LLAKRYRRKGFVVAAQDEGTFGLIPNVVKGWAKKGSRPIAYQNYQHKYTNVFGARTIRTFVYSFTKRKRQREFVAFLKKLLKRWGKVCLFIDNAPWHRGKLVDEFLANHRKTFKIVRFPKYSPELNPVEPCWIPARKKIGNRLVVSLEAMKYHLRQVFNNSFLMPRMFNYLSD
jgi:transposase